MNFCIFTYSLLHKTYFYRRPKEVFKTSPGRRLDNLLKKVVVTSISDQSKKFLRRLYDFFVSAGLMLFSLAYLKTTSYFDLCIVCILVPCCSMGSAHSVHLI